MSQSTTVKLGLVDRTPPRIFGFPAPANGRYLPGDNVGLTFQEPIDCDTRNYPNGQFNVTIEWGNGVRPMVHSAADNYLFFLCSGNVLTITWGFKFDISQVLEQEVTLKVYDIQDVAGNVMTTPASWSFIPTTYTARNAMLKIDGLEIAGVTPATFISDYYTTHNISPDDRIVTDADPFSSFGVAFCAKFDQVVAVSYMQGRCELLKYTVDDRSNTFVSFAITPGTPAATAVFTQFKNALAALPSFGTGNSTKASNATSNNGTAPVAPTPADSIKRRKRAAPAADQNLMGAVQTGSSSTSWDITTDADTIRATLKQPVYPMRYFEAITVVPAGFFVTMAIGVCVGTIALILILVLNKQREKHWNGKVTTREHALLPHALQQKLDEKKGYEIQ